MKIKLILFFASVITVNALPENFVKAIHQVETSGRTGLVLGDYCKKTKTYKSIGPLQIQKSYFIDSRVKGNYYQCTNLAFSIKVMEGYFQRYCPKALKSNDFQTLARTHNGGVAGPKNKSTIKYWERVKKNLTAK